MKKILLSALVICSFVAEAQQTFSCQIICSSAKQVRRLVRELEPVLTSRQAVRILPRVRVSADNAIQASLTYGDASETTRQAALRLKDSIQDILAEVERLQEVDIAEHAATQLQQELSTISRNLN